MQSPEELLFEKSYGGKLLFRNQQELVNQLLNNNTSDYFIAEDSENYTIRLNRLKSYISQLLSENVIRNITPAFKRSLEKLLESRLHLSDFSPKEVAAQIISALAERNKPSNIKTFISQQNPFNELIDDISSANYILVITARHFDIVNNNSKFSLQDFLIKDLFSSLIHTEQYPKYYRFNFPLRSLCDLFWLALRKMLEKMLFQTRLSKEIIETLYLKNLITQHIYATLFQNKNIEEKDIKILAEELIKYLSLNKYIQVFLVDAPIFTAPLIVINPNDMRKSKAFLLLENGSNNTNINKLAIEDILPWKYFVFDRMKTQNLGLQIDYNFAIHNSN